MGLLLLTCLLLYTQGMLARFWMEIYYVLDTPEEYAIFIVEILIACFGIFGALLYVWGVYDINGARLL